MKKPCLKILLGIILISLILMPVSSSFKINRVSAVLGVGDVGTVNVNSITDPKVIATNHATIGGWIKEGANWAWNQKDVVGKWALKTAGQVLKKVLLDRLVDATIAWINRGGKGAIIENWDQFLDKAGNDAAGLAIQSFGAGFLCSPFNVHVQLALLPVKQFSQTTCGLDQIIGNVDSFMENFENGSWIAYQQTWVPKNNFYGATLLAIDKEWQIEAQARENAQSQAIAGKGFLSFEKDEYIEDPNGPYIDKNGTPLTLERQQFGYVGPRYKKIKRVLTPGDFVGDAAKKVVIDTPIDSLIGADDTAQYITAIVNAGINKLTTLGIEGLQGIFKKKNSDFTTITPTAPCSGLTGEAFRACLNYNTSSNNVYQNDRFTVLSQINDNLSPRQQAATALSQLITKQSELVDALTSLAACKPTDNSISNSLNQEQIVLDDLKDQFASNQSYLGPLKQTIDSLNKATTTDYSALTVQSTNAQPALDLGAANDFLNSVQTSAADITANINTKLPSIQSQLSGCGPRLVPVNNNL